MLKNRLLKVLPILLALLLVFTVSAFAAFADETTDPESTEETTTDETSAEESSEATSDETSPEETSDETSSEATSSETTTSGAASSVTTSSETEAAAPVDNSKDDSEEKTPSNIPWKLIITVAVILVIAAILFILTKTNTKLGQKIAKFFKDYKSEIGKISWMPRKDLLRSTLVVLAVLIVAAIVIGLLDFGFSSLVKLLSRIG